MNVKSILIALITASTTIAVYAMEPTTIHDAARIGNLAEVQNFIKHNPTLVNQADASGSTPLHIAVGRNDAALVGFLIENGAYVNQADNTGATPLMTAALWHIQQRQGAESNKAVTLLLLQNGAIIDHQKKECSALSYAYATAAVREDYQHDHPLYQNPRVLRVYAESKVFYQLLRDWHANEQTYAYLAKEALCGAFHPRTGANSPLRLLTNKYLLLELISYVRPELFADVKEEKSGYQKWFSFLNFLGR